MSFFVSRASSDIEHTGALDFRSLSDDPHFVYRFWLRRPRYIVIFLQALEAPLDPKIYVDRGNGFDLGSQWEFKSGVELAYRFADDRRLGVGFYHMSNAGIGRIDPGQAMLTGVFTVPFR